MSEQKIKEMLEMIDAKINHIEDITADNRKIIVKLVKQNNQIVKFLNSLDIHDVEDYDNMMISEESVGSDIKSVKELLDEYLDNSDESSSYLEELKEFEEELQKIKSKITPGQIGEA